MNLFPISQIEESEKNMTRFQFQTDNFIIFWQNFFERRASFFYCFQFFKRGHRIIILFLSSKKEKIVFSKGRNERSNINLGTILAQMIGCF